MGDDREVGNDSRTGELGEVVGDAGMVGDDSMVGEVGALA